MNRPSTLISTLTFSTLIGAYCLITALPFRGDPFESPTTALQFLIWRLLCAVVASVAILIGCGLWTWVAELHRSAKMTPAAHWPAMLEMAVISAFGWWLFHPESIYSFGRNWQIEFSRGTMTALVVICVVMVAWPASLWMRMSATAFHTLAAPSSPPIEAAIQFRELRERAQLVGFVGAIGIAASTLPMGAWRRLVVLADKDSAAAFPSEWVILFGLYWSFTLAVGYVPIYLAITQAGRAIRDAIVPPAPKDSEDFPGWRKRRQEIDAQLGLEGNATDSFKLALAVLSPLIMGVFSTMTGK